VNAKEVIKVVRSFGVLATSRTELSSFNKNNGINIVNDNGKNISATILILRFMLTNAGTSAYPKLKYATSQIDFIFDISTISSCFSVISANVAY
jgi:hypothetical protein